MIEGTAPAVVLQRFDSPNLSPLSLQYTTLPARLTEQARRGWVSQIFVRQWRVLFLLITDIYYLWLGLCNDKLLQIFWQPSSRFVQTNITKTQRKCKSF